MDFLNKAVSQISDLFKTMTPGARMTAGMLLVVIAVSFAYLFVFQGSSANRYLYGGREFSQDDMERMQAAFADENLDDYQPEGKRIRVPGGRFPLYMQALSKAGFSPSNINTDMADLLERGPSIWEPQEEREFRRSQAQQRQLSRIIGMRSDIDWAAARYTEMKEPGFPPKIKRSASVVLEGTSGQPVNRTTISSIRANAGAWFGIDAEQVAVTDQNGISVSPGDSLDGLTPESRKYILAQAWHEDNYERKIEQALSYIGTGLIAVVNVELDKTISNESTKISVDPQAVALQSDTLTKSQDSRPPDAARPGSVPNQVAGNQPRTLQSINQQQSTAEENREQQTSITGHEQIHMVTAGLVPKTVTATVSIPNSYLRDVWHENEVANGNPTPGEPKSADITPVETAIIKQVENQVVKVLPQLAAGENQYPRVVVSTYQDIPVTPPEPPTLATKALNWFSMNWKTLGLFIVGLVSLFVLRGMLRPSAPTEVPAMEHPLPETESLEEEVPQEEPAISLHRRNQPTGISLREELISMVREDPDAAANVLRTWIGDAA